MAWKRFGSEFGMLWGCMSVEDLSFGDDLERIWKRFVDDLGMVWARDTGSILLGQLQAHNVHTYIPPPPPSNP